jgi:hypothetical protein
MDGRDLTAVALRIWGLEVLLDVACVMPRTVLVARVTPSPPEQGELIRAAQQGDWFNLAVMVILGLCLLLWADVLARLAIPPTPEVRVGVDVGQLLTVGLVLVGVYTLIQGLENTAGAAYVVANKPKGPEVDAFSYVWERKSDEIVKAVVDVLVGLTLVLGRAGLVNTWAQVRSFARTGHGVERG